ncbi:MAG: hypothetical protein KAR87_03260 [Candidatus Aenigmarchaeota archaeon]|nr:hypothetical protein [Candidatus Aenigmarchaeota archaeon]
MSFEELIEEIGYSGKKNFYENYDSTAIKKLPLNQKLYSQANAKLRSGKKIKAIEGYLELIKKPSKLLIKKIQFIFKRNKCMESDSGFKLYNFYAELSRNDLMTIIIAPYETKLDSDIPYSIKIKKITGSKLEHNKNYYELFSLMSKPEATTLKISKDNNPKYPVLTLKEMQKSITEISSLSMRDNHVSDSLLSPYIGSDILDRKTYVDGLGASYIYDSRTKKDVDVFDKYLNNSDYGITLEHVGILNELNGTIKEFESMRKNREILKNYNVLSWNVASKIKDNNIRESEYKYAIDGINVYGEKDIANNTALQNSLIYYGCLGDKQLTSKSFNQVLDSSILKISSWMNKTEEIIFNNIYDMDLIEIQCARITSYYTAFEKNNQKIQKNVINTFEKNITQVIEKIDEEKKYNLKEREWKVEIPLDIRRAILISDKTKEDIIANIVELMNWTEKRSEQYFTKLSEEGRIFSRDGGIHYDWVHRYKLKDE